MIERIATVNGSLYELDRERGRVRRVRGSGPATARVGEAEWRPFLSVSRAQVGWSLVIVWPAGTPLHPGSPAGSVPVTETSVVVGVEVVEREAAGGKA